MCACLCITVINACSLHCVANVLLHFVAFTATTFWHSTQTFGNFAHSACHQIAREALVFEIVIFLVICDFFLFISFIFSEIVNSFVHFLACKMFSFYFFYFSASRFIFSHYFMPST